jgi:hypothetical protein
MKIKSLIIASVTFSLAQFAMAQCPEICDPNDNTALGQSALVSNFGGMNNTAVGFQALQNTNADGNTATGFQALRSNNSGTFNAAFGQQALSASTFANQNSGFGAFTLAVNLTGGSNTAVGYEALSRNTASNNTAVGRDALTNNTSGSSNIAIGVNAGSVLTTGSNNIEIGHSGATSSEFNTTRIGSTQTSTFIAGIYQAAVGSGQAVRINSQGKLGTLASSARFKEAIKPMDKTSEAILSLKPVTFRYKKEVDPAGSPEFGLVAEDVAKVDPDLVSCDDQGKPYTVRYEAVNAMLLNEFLKEHRKNEQQETRIAEQQKEIDELKAALR